MPIEKEIYGVTDFVHTFSREFESYLKDFFKKEVQVELDRRDEVSEPKPRKAATKHRYLSHKEQAARTLAASMIASSYASDRII